MKRSDYVETMICPICKPSVGRDQAERAAVLAEKAGVTWEPEEPELPERLGVGPGGSIVDAAHPNAVARSEVHREAARRYNALGKLRKWLKAEVIARYPTSAFKASYFLDKLDSLLQEES